MVAFSKYALLGDLIVIPILLVVQALPTELIGYIGEYVTPPMTRCERLKDRYENIFGELQHIHSRNQTALIEYAEANFTRFGFKETPKTYSSTEAGFIDNKKVYKKATEMDLFSERIKDELRLQALSFNRRITREYATLMGFYDKYPLKDYAQVKLKLGTVYTSIDKRTFFAKDIYFHDDNMISIRWIPRNYCKKNDGVDNCYCERCGYFE